MRREERNYYERNYDSSFVARQQRLFDDYLEGRGGFEKRINFLFDFAKDDLKGHILDIGCGIGTFALVLAQMGFRTVGVDISEKSMEACLSNKNKLNVSDAHFVRANLKSDIFKNGAFDTIVAEDIIEHLSEDILVGTLKHCYQWLRPGGTLILHTYPTCYYYQLCTWASLALLPIFAMKDSSVEPYLKFLHRTYFNFISMVIFRKSIRKFIESHGHCNLPHPFLFREKLINAGFKVLNYRLLMQPLSPLRKNHPKLKVFEKLVSRHEILRPSIVAIAQK